MNTIYLSARWQSSFNPMNVNTGFFYPSFGDPVEMDFLYTNHTPLKVYITDYFESVLLPYDDDRLGLILVRPINDFDPQHFFYMYNFIDFYNQLEEHSGVRVSMPKFDVSFDTSLNDHLKALGLGTAFNRDVANFSNLVESGADDIVPQIYISDIGQSNRLYIIP